MYRLLVEALCFAECSQTFFILLVVIEQIKRAENNLNIIMLMLHFYMVSVFPVRNKVFQDNPLHHKTLIGLVTET